MKTQTRRFITATLLCVALVITLVSIPSSSSGQGVVNISSQAGLGPVNPTTGFVSDVTYALLHGLNSYGSWQALPNGSLVPINKVFSSGSSGGTMYYSLSVTSSTPFTLASIYSTQTSPFFSFSGTIGADGLTYTLFGVGIDANGNTYTAGNANTLVNAVYIVGYGYSIDISGQTQEQALNSWTGLTPFSVQVSYTVGNSTIASSQTFVTSVPEPSTATLCALGGVGLLALIRRRRK